MRRSNWNRAVQLLPIFHSPRVTLGESIRIRTLIAETWLPLPRVQVFAFFSDASNLGAITPPWLHFQLLTPQPIQMQMGTLLDYKLRVRWLPIRWQTEIVVWEPPCRFVDRQNRGPYKLWVHTHEFEDKTGGTLIRDRVDYAVPGWICEPILHGLLVGPDLRRIFAYREARIRELLLGQ